MRPAYSARDAVRDQGLRRIRELRRMGDLAVEDGDIWAAAEMRSLRIAVRELVDQEARGWTARPEVTA